MYWSLPTRERGLKCLGIVTNPYLLMSLPTRERGLKCTAITIDGHIIGSLPTRERGLKFGKLHVVVQTGQVAPHAGAWIEIYYGGTKTIPERVAPHAGAWIEIKIPGQVYCLSLSLPTRERGLK